jgi:dihydroflavonol-4-reductase
MRYLVTGGTGFVGSHLAQILVAAGHGVRVLHRPSSDLAALAGLPVESALGDLGDAQALEAACAGMDGVFHVAAVADYWRTDRATMMAANVEGTRHVLKAAQSAGVGRVVFTSSVAAVGQRPEGGPADEHVAFNLRPERMAYGHSKWLAEEVVRDYVAQGLDAVIVNPGVVIGPGDRNRISGTFILQTARFGRLTPITSGAMAVTDVRDVARWHLRAMQDGAAGERYILMSENVAYRDWFAMIAEALGVGRPFIQVPDWILPPAAAVLRLAARLGLPVPVDADQALLGGAQMVYDGRKAHDAFGPPQVPMQQSLRDAVAWYRAHGML